MIGAIKERVERYLGRGQYSIAVPVMDGPLHPNQRLDEAELLFEVNEIDNLTNMNGDLWFSSGAQLMRRAQGTDEPSTVETYDAPITCLAASGDGALAIGLDGVGVILRGGAHDGRRIETVEGQALTCPTAIAFENNDRVVVTIGAKGCLHADWKRDLMTFGRSGEVWRIDLKTGNTTRLADKLAYPYGICPTPSGLAITEAWAHRVVVLDTRGKLNVVLKDLPGYPSRIAPAPQGGYTLAIFAPRNQLVEFVLQEPEFLTVMTEQVHSDNWIAPKLMWGEGFKEPMQGAALKTMGIIKPWAPTWSYGLVVKLAEDFTPVESFHSRADGTRHGVTSVCTLGDDIVVGSKGSGTVVALAETTAKEMP